METAVVAETAEAMETVETVEIAEAMEATETVAMQLLLQVTAQTSQDIWWRLWQRAESL